MNGAPPPPPPPPSGRPGDRPGFQPPPPPGYAPGVPAGQPPVYPAGQQQPGTNGMAIASLVLGIISLPMCFLFVPGVLAIVFGIVGLNQIKSNPGQGGRGQAIAGLIMGSISVAFVVLAFALAGSTTWNFEAVAATLAV